MAALLNLPTQIVPGFNLFTKKAGMIDQSYGFGNRVRENKSLLDKLQGKK